MKLNTLAACIALTLSAASAHAANVAVKIIAINDFHGQLASPGTLRVNAAATSPTLSVGGADYVAGYIANYKAQNPMTLVVSAGDLIGATPLVSALFHDEPTIEVMNRIGLNINAVGNHEFDEGKNELLRMQTGGCHPTDPNSCQGTLVGTPVPFEGADFQFLAANVVDNASGKTIFPPYAIKVVNGVRVAFIGMTLKDTPTIVTPSGVAGLTFADEAQTVNALIPKLRARGVEAVVVLIHQGGTVPDIQAADTINSCTGNLDGSPIKTIINQLDDEVDLVISGHTHQAYNCQIANGAGRLIPVTSANSQGRVISDITLNIESSTREVTSVNAVNTVVDRGNTVITPSSTVQNLVAGYTTISQPIANRVIGEITASMPHNVANAAGEIALGDVIADAQLAATAPAGFGGAVAAFMNPGGIRSPGLTYTSSSAGEGDGRVTYGEAFTVQPFGNSLVTLTLTGAQIDAMLEQQFMGCNATNAPASFNYPASDTTGQSFNRILQVSNGFSYTWSASGPGCDKVDPSTIRINGMAVDPALSYRITVNSFLADGGDKFYVLSLGNNRLGGAQDLDALEAWLNNVSADSDLVTSGVQVTPGLQNRITQVP